MSEADSHWFLARFFCVFAVAAVLLSDDAVGQESGSSETCDAASGTCSGPGMERQVFDKTPTPCLKKYDDELVGNAVSAHLAKAVQGHQAPHLLMLLGGSGAGKGTFMKHLVTHGLDVDNFVFHGLDEYLVYLPEFVKSVNDPDAVYKDAADDCYGGAIAIAKAAQGKLIAQRQHTIYEETGKNLDRILKRVIPPFEDAGYRITVVLVDNSPDVAKRRAKGRFLKEGRYAPDDYIEGTFKNVPENFKALRTGGRVHEAVYCDNSCMGPGSEARQANQSKCLQCWRDEVPKASGESLIPHSALMDGQPLYLNAGAAGSR